MIRASRPGEAMQTSRIVVVAVLAVTVTVGCATSSATSQQVRKTADGGTILITDGADFAAAARYTISAIESHCRGPYEVVEIARADTGQSVSHSQAVSYNGATSASGSSSVVYGTAVTYLCRTPKSAALNLNLSQMSSNLLGAKCRSSDDCGVLVCRRYKDTDEFGDCGTNDSFRTRKPRGGECSSDKDCMEGLSCWTNAFSAKTCY